MNTSKLLASSESYRLLVDGIIDYSIYLLEVDGTIASWNAGARRMKGYEAHEIIGRNFSTFYVSTDAASGEPQRALRIAATEGKFEGEGWRRRKDGTRFWASVVVDALHDEHRRVTGFAKVTRDITERTMREQQRQVIVDAAPNGMLVIDASGTISSANRQAERILGTTSDALVGLPVSAVITRVSPAEEDARERTPQPLDLQSVARATARRPDGASIALEVTFNEIPTASGQVIVASIVDVTERLRLEAERVRSEAALLEANRLMSMAEEMAHYGHWRYDLRSGRVFWSDEVYRSRGLPKTYVPTPESSLADYDTEGVDVREIIRRATTDGAPYTFESRVRRTDGSVRDVRVSGRGEFEAGSLVALAGIYVDITELKTAERERDRLIERVVLATQAGNIGIWEWDIRNDVTLWDQRMFALYGLVADTKLGSFEAWFDFIHSDDRARIRREVQAALAQHAPFDTEFRVIWKTGEIRNLHAKGTVVRDARDTPIRMVGTVWDITEVRTLTEQLREEREHQLAYEREQRYEHERKWSTTFQRAVLPLTLPDVPGCEFDAVYEPGLGDAQVGGDWYDAVRLIDGRVLVSIGDVAGNGLEAAVVVGVVRQIMRGIAQLHANPMLILDAADRALSLEYPGVYVTAWVGIIDLVNATITYASAGHPPPLIVARDGTLRELIGTTLPIGLREGHQGVASTVAISDGDSLVLYTDGVTEATRDPIAGAERLHAAAAGAGREHAAAAGAGREHAADPAEFIKREVIPAGSHDDVAILVVRMNLAAAEQQIVRLRLNPADGHAASSARRYFTNLLTTRGFSAGHVANAELVFGELIGNVVCHAGRHSPIDVAIDFGGPRTVLHVMDRGAGFRHISRLRPDPYAENGRGLFLIAAMTAEFTVGERPRGGSHARAVLIDQTSSSLLTPQTLPALGDFELDPARDESPTGERATANRTQGVPELAHALRELDEISAEITRRADKLAGYEPAAELTELIGKYTEIARRLSSVAGEDLP